MESGLSLLNLLRMVRKRDGKYVDPQSAIVPNMKYYINGAVIISKMVCAGHGHVLGQNCKIVVKSGVKAKWH